MKGIMTTELPRNAKTPEPSDDQVIQLFANTGQDNPIAGLMNDKETRVFARIEKLINEDGADPAQLPAHLAEWVRQALSQVGGPKINGRQSVQYDFQNAHQRNIDQGLGNTVRDFLYGIRIFEAVGRTDIRNHYQETMDLLLAEAAVLQNAKADGL